MGTTIKHVIKAFGEYLRRTYINKLLALAIIITGVISVKVIDGDITFLVMMLLIAIPVFFASDDCIRKD